jgi:ferredoxin--NADP+ reductase
VIWTCAGMASTNWRPSLNSGMHKEKVISVKHYSDKLFSFKTTRNAGLRLDARQFTMIGLDNKTTRAYSIVSGPGEDYLEFLSIVVPEGPLTSKLKDIKQGDEILIGPKPVGTLLCDSLKKDTTLWLIGTGTGIAPFVSICRDADTYLKFKKVIVCHTVRTVKELAYYDYFFNLTVQEFIQYYPTVTREDWVNKGRITDHIKTGEVFSNLEVPPMTPENDSVMLCGSPDFNAEMIKMLKDNGWQGGSLGRQGNFVYEKAFVDK